MSARLGLGLAALGRPAYVNVDHAADLAGAITEDALERRCHDVLDGAWAAGIRHVDTARSYGNGELFLSRWLERRGVRREDLVVSSKWGYRYVSGFRLDAPVHEVKDHSAAALRAQLQESRALLGPWLGLYQIHSATLDTGVLRDHEVRRELSRARDEGLAIGLSLSGPRQAEALREALAVGDPFSWVQATWNLYETSCEPALREAKARGWGVIVKEALANGRLAREPRLGPTPALVALAAALAKPWADVVLSGAATVEQVRQGARAAALDPGPLPELAEEPNAYWSARARLPWT